MMPLQQVPTTNSLFHNLLPSLQYSKSSNPAGKNDPSLSQSTTPGSMKKLLESLVLLLLSDGGSTLDTKSKFPSVAALATLELIHLELARRRQQQICSN